jgi:hypothetical protein
MAELSLQHHKEIGMKRSLVTLALLGATLSTSAFATGLATCDSGAQESWQPQAKLEHQLKEKGWQVRRIKIDGGCYEVYALNEKGERVEAYFHPKTLAPVPTKKE